MVNNKVCVLKEGRAYFYKRRQVFWLLLESGSSYTDNYRAVSLAFTTAVAAYRTCR